MSIIDWVLLFIFLILTVYIWYFLLFGGEISTLWWIVWIGLGFCLMEKNRDK